MNMINSYIVLGHITQTRGLQGKVAAQLTCSLTTLDPVDFIFIQIGHTYVPYQVEEKILSRPDQALFQLQGITNRSTAHEIVGKSIWLPQDLLNKILVKSAPTDQIVGYHLIDEKLGDLGVVKRIEVFPMHRCLVVDYQAQELLIPYVSALITALDHAHKKLVTNLPGGFLEAMRA